MEKEKNVLRNKSIGTKVSDEEYAQLEKLAEAYDSVNRLTSAQNAGLDCSLLTVNGKTKYWGNSYTYDAWGNLNQKTVTKCGAEYLNVAPLTNNQLTGYGYDAAGNMTGDPTDSVASTYDQENRISVATNNGVATTYVYDAEGNRVQKSNGTAGTLYWYMAPGIVAESDLSGNLTSEYMFFGGERVARRDLPSGSVAYYFSDRLKTASVIIDAVGNIKAESDYYPWGGELQFVNNDTNHYKFTGKERDSETQLDYFGARYYSNGLGRWVSADWSPTPIPVPYAHFDDPQSLNLYNYVRNVPTSAFDLDGHGCPPDCPLTGWDRVRMGSQGFLDTIGGGGKIGGAAAAGVSTPVTGPVGVAGVIYGGISGSGQTVAGVMEMAGSILPSNAAKDFQKGANVAVAITTVAGIFTLAKTGDADKAADAATVESLGTRALAGKLTSEIKDTVIDVLNLIHPNASPNSAPTNQPSAGSSPTPQPPPTPTPPPPPPPDPQDHNKK